MFAFLKLVFLILLIGWTGWIIGGGRKSSDAAVTFRDSFVLFLWGLCAISVLLSLLAVFNF